MIPIVEMKKNGLLLMLFLATPTSIPPAWHSYIFEIIGGIIAILLTIIGVLIIRWMNKIERERDIDRKRQNEERKTDMEILERMRVEDNRLMREAIHELTETLAELTDETRNKALSDAKFEAKVLFQVKDFQSKMMIMNMNIEAHSRELATFRNEIDNIKKRHKVNHGEDI